MKPSSLFDHIPDALPEELFEVLAESDAVRIERIVSRGQSSPPDFWYEQDQSEFVLLIQGQAKLRLEAPAEVVELRPGDWITIPSHRRHRVDWTAPDCETIWLTVFFQAAGAD